VGFCYALDASLVLYCDKVMRATSCPCVLRHRTSGLPIFGPCRQFKNASLVGVCVCLAFVVLFACVRVFGGSLEVWVIVVDS